MSPKSASPVSCAARAISTSASRSAPCQPNAEAPRTTAFHEPRHQTASRVMPIVFERYAAAWADSDST